MAPLVTVTCLALLGLAAAAGPYGSSKPSTSYGAPKYVPSYSSSSSYGDPKYNTGYYDVPKTSSGYDVPKYDSSYDSASYVGPKPSNGYDVPKYDNTYDTASYVDPKPSNGYGAPKYNTYDSVGYDGPSSGYGGPKPNSGYGAPMYDNTYDSVGYDGPKKPSSGYGGPKPNSGYGAPMYNTYDSVGYSGPKSSSGYGVPQVRPGAVRVRVPGKLAPFTSGSSEGFPTQLGKGSSKYYLSWKHSKHANRKYTWEQADRECRALGQHLVSLTSQQKEHEINSQLGSKQNVPYYWTSGRREGNKFVWGDEKRTPVCPPQGKGCHQNWSRTGGDKRPQPDNRERNENCVAVLNRFYPGEGIVWHDIGCHHKKFFVCEA